MLIRRRDLLVNDVYFYCWWCFRHSVKLCLVLQCSTGHHVIIQSRELRYCCKQASWTHSWCMTFHYQLPCQCAWKWCDWHHVPLVYTRSSCFLSSTNSLHCNSRVIAIVIFWRIVLLLAAGVVFKLLLPVEQGSKRKLSTPSILTSFETGCLIHWKLDRARWSQMVKKLLMALLNVGVNGVVE